MDKFRMFIALTDYAETEAELEEEPSSRDERSLDEIAQDMIGTGQYNYFLNMVMPTLAGMEDENKKFED